MQLEKYNAIFLKQRFEVGELLGFESRNKYEITAEPDGPIGFAAEQQKGLIGLLMRQLLGHWRYFEIHIFDSRRELTVKAIHPFRFFFQRLEVYDKQDRRLGALQQRFAILTKSFDIEDGAGQVIMTVRSPFWRLWTFPVLRNEQEVAKIMKRWTGALTELLTDKDTFVVQYSDPKLTPDVRKVLLAAGIFVDLQYFEKKN